MRAVIQRVSEASVSIDNEIVSAIDFGILIFLGIEIEDTTADSLWLAKKIAHLRIFSDEKGRMNNSIIDIDEEVIVVSQFTLHAKTKKGIQCRSSREHQAKHEQRSLNSNDTQCTYQANYAA